MGLFLVLSETLSVVGCDHDDRIRLYDANGNIADDVHYFEGSKWDAIADGGGSSLELIDADADNNRGSSWSASDQTSDGEWKTHSLADHVV